MILSHQYFVILSAINQLSKLRSRFLRMIPRHNTAISISTIDYMFKENSMYLLFRRSLITSHIRRKRNANVYGRGY